VAGEWLTSAEAAALLGVSASTIKRWVDDGELESERTEGGHRRIRQLALESFRARMAGLDPATHGPSAQLVDLLLSDVPSQLIEARLLELRGKAGGAAGLGDWLGPALVDLGERWRSGRITIVEEHFASERLGRSLARLAEWVPLSDFAPRALLAMAEGDDHTLGLSMCELVVREAGWATLWAGRYTPSSGVAAMITARERRIGLVLLSASVVSTDKRALAEQERLVGAACEATDATLVLGGSGAWPARPKHALLVRDLRQLDLLARQLRR
jgi:excisionase family DNA binding protein